MIGSFGIHQFEVVLLLLLVLVVVFAALAERMHAPYPIVLVIAGLCISFIPGIPKITLSPDAIFFIFLPHGSRRGASFFITSSAFASSLSDWLALPFSV